MRYANPIELQEASDGITVTSPDIPELVSEGGTSAEALERAQDALVSALSFYVDDARPLPLPSAARGQPVIAAPTLEAAKLALHDAMIAANLSNLELAHRLGIDEKAVRRLVDPLYRSHIGAVETALRTLGRRLVVAVTEAA